MKKLFSFLAVFMSSFLFAQQFPAPGTFTIQGEAIYLLPNVGDTYFVFDGNEVTPSAGNIGSGVVKENSLGFKPGFRVAALYGFSNGLNCLSLEWSHLNGHERRVIVGFALSPTQTSPGSRSTAARGSYNGSASSKVCLYNDDVSLLWERKTYCSRHLLLHLVGGAQYAHIRHTDRRFYNHYDGTQLEDTHLFTHFLGIGPQGGINGHYRFWKNEKDPCSFFSLEVLATGSLLVSQTHAEFTYDNTLGADWTGRQERTWTVIPAWNLRAGLGYNGTFHGTTVALEMGYEFSVFLNAIPELDSIANAVGETRAHFYNYTDQGPYLSLGLGF